MLRMTHYVPDEEIYDRWMDDVNGRDTKYTILVHFAQNRVNKCRDPDLAMY